MNRKIIGLLILGTLLISGCIGEEKPSTENEVTVPTTKAVAQDHGQVDDVVYFPDGTAITLEIMRTLEEQRRGLMYREGIGENEGMLFYSKRDYAAGKNLFWMKNVEFPIDMIWMDKDFEIVYIERNVPPCTTEVCPVYGPQDIVSRHVLEVKANLSAEHGLKVGDTLSVKMRD